MDRIQETWEHRCQEQILLQAALLQLGKCERGINVMRLHDSAPLIFPLRWPRGEPHDLVAAIRTVLRDLEVPSPVFTTKVKLFRPDGIWSYYT